MRAREGIDLVHLVDDARHCRIWREIDLEEGRPDSLTGNANVGNRDLVALAITSGLLSSPKDAPPARSTPPGASAGPISCTPASSTLNSCARYSRTRGTISGCVSQATICERPRTRARAFGSFGKQRRIGMCLVEIFDDGKRFEKHRAVTVDQRRNRHHRIDRAKFRIALVTLHQIDFNHSRA